ncbi:hypothetical protein [Nocardioides sp.]|uniref:hypothetical protein n=1 Tax=Nocardioides sp. TaxID=35761 RepID=UPI00261F1C40|nr:hypothetical protein [Nocardioides sp.]
MIDQDLAIEPPPSLEAILSHRERIGRVDFTHRLVAAPPPPSDQGGEPDEGDPARQDPQGPQGSEESPDGAAGTTDPATDDVSVDQAVDGPVDEAVDQAVDVVDEDTGDDQQHTEPAAEVTEARGEQDPDDFLLAPPVDDSPAAHARAEASAQVAALLSLVPAEDVDTVTEDVSEVVEGVLARIREVQSATLAHLEAIEVEAALRCEMLTAQAELDAELIRLHARREAHAILAAARARSGLPPAVPDDVRRLDHLAGAASRLVESLEEPGLSRSSDHPFLP